MNPFPTLVRACQTRAILIQRALSGALTHAGAEISRRYAPARLNGCFQFLHRGVQGLCLNGVVSLVLTMQGVHKPGNPRLTQNLLLRELPTRVMESAPDGLPRVQCQIPLLSAGAADSECKKERTRILREPHSISFHRTGSLYAFVKLRVSI